MYGIRLGFNLWEFSIVNRKTLHYLNCVKWSRQLNSFWVNGLLCISKRLHGWVSQISPSKFKLHHLVYQFDLQVGSQILAANHVRAHSKRATNWIVFPLRRENDLIGWVICFVFHCATLCNIVQQHRFCKLLNVWNVCEFGSDYMPPWVNLIDSLDMALSHRGMIHL